MPLSKIVVRRQPGGVMAIGDVKRSRPFRTRFYLSLTSHFAPAVPASRTSRPLQFSQRRKRHRENRFLRSPHGGRFPRSLTTWRRARRVEAGAIVRDLPIFPERYDVLLHQAFIPLRRQTLQSVWFHTGLPQASNSNLPSLFHPSNETGSRRRRPSYQPAGTRWRGRI